MTFNASRCKSFHLLHNLRILFKDIMTPLHCVVDFRIVIPSYLLWPKAVFPKQFAQRAVYPTNLTVGRRNFVNACSDFCYFSQSFWPATMFLALLGNSVAICLAKTAALWLLIRDWCSTRQLMHKGNYIFLKWRPNNRDSSTFTFHFRNDTINRSKWWNSHISAGGVDV